MEQIKKYTHKQRMNMLNEWYGMTDEDELNFLIPLYYSVDKPKNWKEYRRQKPMILFVPSDKEVIFVESEGAFGFIEN